MVMVVMAAAASLTFLMMMVMSVTAAPASFLLVMMSATAPLTFFVMMLVTMPTATAFAVLMMVSAAAAFTVFMVMVMPMAAATAAAFMVAAPAAFVMAAVSAVVARAVMVADKIGVKGEPAGDQRLDRLVGVPDDAGVKGDARLGKGGAGAAADAAADQRIRAVGFEEPGQRPVAAAAGADDRGGEDFPALDLVEFKLGAMAEVLEDLAVIVIGNRNFHMGIVPFCMGGGRGELVIAAGDGQRQAAGQALGDLPPGVAIDRLDGRPGDPHPGGRFRLGEAQQVDEPDRLIFVEGHHNTRPRVRAAVGAKPAAAGGRRYPPSFAGTGHPAHLLFVGICH